MGVGPVPGAILGRRRRAPVRWLRHAFLLLLACHPGARRDETAGWQRSGRWEWHGRLVVATDSVHTLVRLAIDTAGIRTRRDVVLARFEFDPAPSAGDEYALSIGLELGVAAELPLHRPLALGPPPAHIPAYATVTHLGTPLRPDSVRGTFTLTRRGLRQLTGRIDAVLHFTAWSDPARRSRYELHQAIHGVK